MRFDWSPSIRAAMLPFRTQLDERGLLPVEVAREILRVAPATPQTRDQADGMWAAVLSLEDVSDLIDTTAHLSWERLVPGQVDRSLVDRYGEDLVDWIATRVHDGALSESPHVLPDCLRCLASVRALELILGIEDNLKLLFGWARGHADLALLPLFDRVAQLPEGAKDPALTTLETLILCGPVSAFRRIEAARGEEAEAVFRRFGLRRALTEAPLLAILDDAAGLHAFWPRFCFGDDDHSEYFGLRLVLARAPDGDAWGLVPERLEGAAPDSLRVQRFSFDAFGVRTTTAYLNLEISADASGGARVGDAVFSAEELSDPALLPERSTEPAAIWALRRVAIRAYLDRFPNALWPSPSDALFDLAMSGLEPLLVTTAFEHVSDDGTRPSESQCYRSAVDTLVSGDPTRFVPGPANTAWRLHATHVGK